MLARISSWSFTRMVEWLARMQFKASVTLTVLLLVNLEVLSW